MPLEGPAVRARDAGQLVRGLGQRDVEHRLAAPHAFEQELERERRLAGARDALDQVEAVRREAAAEDVVEAGDAGAQQRVVAVVAGRAGGLCHVGSRNEVALQYMLPFRPFDPAMRRSSSVP